MRTNVTRVLLSVLVLLGAQSASAKLWIYQAIDISYSLDADLWRQTTLRVAADIASLPPGSEARVVSFGLDTSKPLYQGAVLPDTREGILSLLHQLRPSEGWTRFSPVLADARFWLQGAAVGDQLLVVIYSDGETSLPPGPLADVPMKRLIGGEEVIPDPCLHRSKVDSDSN